MLFRWLTTFIAASVAGTASAGSCTCTNGTPCASCGCDGWNGPPHQCSSCDPGYYKFAGSKTCSMYAGSCNHGAIAATVSDRLSSNWCGSCDDLYVLVNGDSASSNVKPTCACAYPQSISDTGACGAPPPQANICLDPNQYDGGKKFNSMGNGLTFGTCDSYLTGSSWTTNLAVGMADFTCVDTPYGGVNEGLANAQFMCKGLPQGTGAGTADSAATNCLYGEYGLVYNTDN